MRATNIIKVSCILALLGVAGSFNGVAHAVSYDGFWQLFRSNSAGTSFAVLRPHANHFCYLGRVSVEETDTGGEEVHCRVRRSGSVWLLEAILDRSSDADVKCAAYCYNN
jgi:hypothetical protein